MSPEDAGKVTRELLAEMGARAAEASQPTRAYGSVVVHFSSVSGREGWTAIASSNCGFTHYRMAKAKDAEDALRLATEHFGKEATLA